MSKLLLPPLRLFQRRPSFRHSSCVNEFLCFVSEDRFSRWPAGILEATRYPEGARGTWPHPKETAELSPTIVLCSFALAVLAGTLRKPPSEIFERMFFFHELKEGHLGKMARQTLVTQKAPRVTRSSLSAHIGPDPSPQLQMFQGNQGPQRMRQPRQWEQPKVVGPRNGCGDKRIETLLLPVSSRSRQVSASSVILDCKEGSLMWRVEKPPGPSTE